MATDMNSLPRYYDTDNNWIIPLFVTGLLVVVTIRLLQNDKLKLIFNAALRLKQVQAQFGEDMPLSSATSAMLSIGSILMHGLFFYEAVSFFSLSPFSKGLSAYVTICLFFAGWNVYRATVLWITWQITQTGSALKEIRYSSTVLNQASALLYLPILIFARLASVPEISLMAMWIAVGIFVFIELARLYRSFVISMGYGFSLFYFILYICALEILPLILILKTFAG